MTNVHNQICHCKKENDCSF